MDKLKKLFKSVKNSFKSVLLNSREFVGIYIAVLIVQLLLSIWAQSAFTNYSVADDMLSEHFPFDIVIESEDQTKLDTIAGIFRSDLSSDSVKSDPTITDFGRFDGKLGVNVKKNSYDKFCNEYRKFIVDDEISVEKTPKYTYNAEFQDGTIITSVITGIVSFAASVLIMSVMYSVRTNHYKFQYGIYMTFGADKKMLGRIALGELLSINTLLLIPSYVIAVLISQFLIYGYYESAFSAFSIPQFLIYILLSYVVVLIASLFSLGELFLKPPVALITTADNSNFVSSPRRSLQLFGKNIPLHYEGFTVWRYRKYFLKLISGAVAFSVIFILGVYSANIILLDQNAAKEEYVLEFEKSTAVNSYRLEANADAEEIIEKLEKLPHVHSARIEQSSDMKMRGDHLLLQQGSYPNASNYTVKCSNLQGFTKATNKSRYVCIDTTVLRMYEKLYGVEYLEGYTAENLPNAKNMIIISEGLYGKSCFSFAPGDKVAIGEKKSGGSTNLPVTSDPMKALEQQLDSFSYNYTEYTVGAVIHDKDATESIIVGLNTSDFYELTTFKRSISSISVYLESGLGLDDVADVREDVKNIMSDYNSWSISYTDSSVFNNVNRKLNIPVLLYVLSSLVLIITPVIWIFSQIMFFKKREAEFKTLLHIGASMKQIRGIHLVSSVAVFIIGFAANFILSRIACYAIYEIFTSYPRNECFLRQLCSLVCNAYLCRGNGILWFPLGNDTLRPLKKQA